MTLELLEKEYAVCRLAEPVAGRRVCVADGERWGDITGLRSCGGARRRAVEQGWRGLRVAGVLDFSLVYWPR